MTNYIATPQEVFCIDKIIPGFNETMLSLIETYKYVDEYTSEKECGDILEDILEVEYQREYLAHYDYGLNQYRRYLDFLITEDKYNPIIVELKSQKRLTKKHENQLRGYLNLFQKKKEHSLRKLPFPDIGILCNIGWSSFEVRVLYNDESRDFWYSVWQDLNQHGEVSEEDKEKIKKAERSLLCRI